MVETIGGKNARFKVENQNLGNCIVKVDKGIVFSLETT
jgi:hypothetical protein